MGAEAFLTLQIVDFAEGVDDRVAALLQAGTGITLTYNDGAGTLTIANTGLGGSTGSVANRVLTANGTGGSTVQATNIEIDANNLLRQTINQTDVAITSGTGDAWSVNNSGSQTKVTFAFGGTIRGGYRIDSSGNFNWHATGNQGHQFYLGSGNNQGFSGNGLVVNCQAGGATAIQGISVFGAIGFRGGSNTSNSNDVQIVRNSTGPTAETRAAGGLRVRTADGSAAGAVDCGAITASGAVECQSGFILASRTKAAVLASSTAVNSGRFQLSDAGLIGREVYPDGTNWRYASDDSIVS